MANIAIVPARLSSKGFPGKNRLFFSLTIDFIKSSDIFDRVIINSDDENLLLKAADMGFDYFERSKDLSGDNTSIKAVFEDMVIKTDIKEDDYLWLFYIPLLYKNIDDFIYGKKAIEKNYPDSISTFIPAKTHPYCSWKYDNNERIISKYIDNELYNRQDFPDAWENYHYVFAIRANAIEQSDNNLLSNKTEPLFLDNKKAERLIEIDTPEDLMKWKYKDQIAYEKWLNTLNDNYRKILLEIVDPEML